ncbi:matrixin family metalloprotease [Streptomyces lasiicapitis]|uniref:matrixin family metalloprotease n=1 Tax=Streptomyces lasiicapitis TaxID=1923961 RepID=UPI00364611AF
MKWNARFMRRRAAVLALALSASVISVGPQATASPGACSLPSGELSVGELPAGSSVIECDAVGRIVRHDNIGVTVPQPGMGVNVTGLAVDGGHNGFSLSVSENGIVSYDLDGDESESPTGGADAPDDISDPVITPDDVTEEADDDNADQPDTPQEGETPVLTDEDFQATAVAACSDDARKYTGWAEFGTYNWYIGDGGMPGGLTRTQAMWAFQGSINSVTNPTSCGYNDPVKAKEDYKGRTTYETDISSSGNCTDRDKKSTWDAGNLASSTLAVSCTWTAQRPGPDDVRESDVRFNTHDHGFTNNPTSNCHSQFDIRSIGAHEAGHVFGLDHVTGGRHANLTMTPGSGPCETHHRTLGKGDIIGMRDLYRWVH